MSNARCDLSIRRVRQIGTVMALVYCLGFFLQVAGWHLQRHNGGVKAPHPVFLSRELLGTLSIVAMNVLTYWRLCAAALGSDDDRDAASPGHADG